MASTRPLQPGDPRRLGAYELVGRLGEGGQGVVYLARRAEASPGKGPEPDGSAAPFVAIKLLRADLTADPTARTRLMRELAAAKKVADFTARVLDADVIGDRPYIVSEFVDGPSLQRLVAEEGPRTGSALLWLAIATASAVNAIHRADIVHRDLKPHNVLVSRDGPRVIDFGIARALDATSTLTSGVVGTPAYMAPEMLDEADISPKTDIFAWGATIVYAATGTPPFGDRSMSAVINRILHHDPDLSDVPESLRVLIASCLAKDPAARPTAREALDHLHGPSEDTAAVAATPVNVPDGDSEGVREDRPPRDQRQAREDAGPVPVPPSSPPEPLRTPFAPAESPASAPPSTPSRASSRGRRTTLSTRLRQRAVALSAVATAIVIAIPMAFTMAPSKNPPGTGGSGLTAAPTGTAIEERRLLATYEAAAAATRTAPGRPRHHRDRPDRRTRHIGVLCPEHPPVGPGGAGPALGPDQAPVHHHKGLLRRKGVPGLGAGSPSPPTTSPTRRSTRTTRASRSWTAPVTSNGTSPSPSDGTSPPADSRPTASGPRAGPPTASGCS